MTGLMNYKRLLAALLLLLTASLSFGQEKQPKYIFYFIGDGMGPSQRQLGEYYLESVNAARAGAEGFRLRMNRMPVAAIYSSHSADSLVTDSAAGGTALACGIKTDNEMVGVRSDGMRVDSIADAAKEKGMAVGLVTSTRLTHATPASFYAHNVSRNNENEIAIDLLKSGFDFFAGGGYRHLIEAGNPVGKSKRPDGRNIKAELEGRGYLTFMGESKGQAFLSWKPAAGDRVVAALAYSHIPFELDRKQGSPVPSLAQMTAKGVELLSLDEDGFFMMVEGGRIDHACHANDPAGAVHDVLAFDDAIDVAYDFYSRYPDETLIVVASDHETGGVGLGFSLNYFLTLKSLASAKGALTDRLCENDPYVKGTDHTVYMNKIKKITGITDFSAAELSQLEAMMSAVDANPNFGKDLYGYYDPVTMTLAKIVSERAGIQWTTYAHTGTQLSLSAVGAGSEIFGGYYDNTRIPKLIAKAAGLSFAP